MRLRRAVPWSRWATNIAALGTAIGVLLAAGGTLASIYPRAPADATVALAADARDVITVTGGATATVVGVADITLPGGTTIRSPRHRVMQLKADTSIVVPSDANSLAADMRSLLSAAALTTFGIGTEIGLIAVLAIHFSGADFAGQVAAWAISAVGAAGLVLYGATAIRALADPAPGSSLSAQSGTSFTPVRWAR